MIAKTQLDLTDQSSALTADGLPNRDLELGMRAAKAAFDACNGQDANIVDTYARAFYEIGDLEQAIKWQQKAVELAKHDRQRAELTKTLRMYTSQE